MTEVRQWVTDAGRVYGISTERGVAVVHDWTEFFGGRKPLPEKTVAKKIRGVLERLGLRGEISVSDGGMVSSWQSAVAEWRPEITRRETA